MREFFESGALYLIVGLLCMVAGVISERTVVFVAIGGFWVIMAVVVRAKNTTKGKHE